MRMGRLTARQLVVLQRWYVEGWSHRRIGEELGISHAAVQNLIIRGRRWFVETAESQGVAKSPLVEGVITPSSTASLTRHVGRAASRREDLLEELELRMQQRADELAAFEQLLSGNSSHPTHVKRNSYDQWELRYLSRTRRKSMATSAYDCKRAAGSCAMNGQPCPLGCAGCYQKR